jgi:large subunit ribosomal protein L24
VTVHKADGSEVSRPIHPSNVIVTKLELKDKRRMSKLEGG